MNNQALKDLIKGLSKLLLLTSDIATKGLSWTEGGLAISLLTDLPTIVAEAPQLLSEYLGLDDQARQNLLSEIQVDVKFPADANVEAIVAKVLGVAVELSASLALLK